MLAAADWLIDRADGLRPRCGHEGHTPKVYASYTYLRPIERMLLGSLVGVFIAGLWIWISARAGR
jgi:hypothetical protein